VPESAADQRRKYPLAAYNFRVTVGDTAMSFTEVSGLVREYQTLTYKHGLSYWEGESLTKFRYDKFVQVTMKKGVVAGVNALYEWLDEAEKKNISVSLCDEKGEAVITWQIRKAVLVKLEAPGLQASGNDAAIETLTLMASGISIERH
jgi:phage tail-like protein